MLKNVNPVLLSRTVRSKPSPEGSLATTRWSIDALNEAGSREKFRDWEINAIDPCSGPRRRSLKTRMLKKELGATANCRCESGRKGSVTSFRGARLILFKRFRLRLIFTFSFYCYSTRMYSC